MSNRLLGYRRLSRPPLKIAGYIDAILNDKKLTGIGTTQFLSCQQLVLDENFSGYSLTYSVIHGNDDRLG